jgi:hypothetical protein
LVYSWQLSAVSFIKAISFQQSAISFFSTRSQVALGNEMVAKLSLAGKGIPKPSLGTRK